MPKRPLRLAALPLLLAISGCGHKTPDQTASPTVAGVSASEVATDWTAENPTEPAVPVVLPSTRLTNQSVEATAPAK